MITSSALWSTSVTKSLADLVVILRRSRSSEARLMIAPALRAAFTAVLSMGCRASDMRNLFEDDEGRWRGRKSVVATMRCG